MVRKWGVTANLVLMLPTIMRGFEGAKQMDIFKDLVKLDIQTPDIPDDNLIGGEQANLNFKIRIYRIRSKTC